MTLMAKRLNLFHLWSEEKRSISCSIWRHILYQKFPDNKCRTSSKMSKQVSEKVTQSITTCWAKTKIESFNNKTNTLLHKNKVIHNSLDIFLWNRWLLRKIQNKNFIQSPLIRIQIFLSREIRIFSHFWARFVFISRRAFIIIWSLQIKKKTRTFPIKTDTSENFK